MVILALLALQQEDMVLVPAGEFVMGSDEGNADERPARRVHVCAFYIDRHEVTNAQFAGFVRASDAFDRVEGPWFRYYAPGCADLIAHYERRYGVALAQFEPDGAATEEDRDRRRLDLARWRAAAAARASLPEEDRSRHPVRGVTWRDAAAYARWAGKRLPTEAEWEKAARGADARVYPWGSEWDPARCRAGPAPVGSCPDGASPYGVLDMAGNVWEWVEDWYGEDYYAAGEDVDPKGPRGLPDGQLPAADPETNRLRSVQQGRESDTRKVIRGGAWAGPEGQARFNMRTSRRLWSNPGYGHPDVGFRCAKDAP